LKNIQDWIDLNGLVKPRWSWSSSGNGLLYSSIARILGFNFAFNIRSCMKEPGLLMRTPDNSFGQQSWDDYLGVACLCIHDGITDIPKEILKYGVKHGFFFNNIGPFSFKAFLGRFPQVWALMWIAAYPWLKWPMYPVLWAIQCTFRFDLDDTSGYQLEWLFLRTCSKLGFNFESYEIAKLEIKTAWGIYYDKLHVFQDADVS